MAELTRDDIRQRFASSANFNEIFDAFESAISQKIDDVELYRILFWNDSLGPDEIMLFGEKLAKDFPHIAYDVYMWLANVFELLFSSHDNFEQALAYYEKAAAVKPTETDPYLDACDCYNPDLNIPPISALIEFLKVGIECVSNKKSLCNRLANLYHISGDEDLAEYYRVKADESGE
jgi:tetratricopeptide (TPR) repeat protein